ncbi:MAG: hypothetical protein HYY51_00470 [Candidatus Magasanikbacteria bacterium]|nr:hypothetical protein [Candidatus Magasanikbacteria bacterium]
MKWNHYPFKLYIKRLSVSFFFGSALLLNIASFLWLALGIKSSSEQLFLHYTILFGVDYIGQYSQVYAVPGAGLIILIVNFLIGWFAYHKDPFVAQLLNFISFVCQIFVVFASYLIIFLNV